MVVSDREFEALTVRVDNLDDRILQAERVVHGLETSSAETRGEARAAAMLASRLVALVAVLCTVAQFLVNVYWHTHHGGPVIPR